MTPSPNKRRGPITLLMMSRRLRWWTFGVLVALPILYVASFGPACWLTAWTPPYELNPEYTGSRWSDMPPPPRWMLIFRPLIDHVLYNRNRSIGNRLYRWAMWGVKPGYALAIPAESEGASTSFTILEADKKH